VCGDDGRCLVTLPANIAAVLSAYSQSVEDHTEHSSVPTASKMLACMQALDTAIAELAAERDRAVAERDAAVARCRSIAQTIIETIGSSSTSPDRSAEERFAEVVARWWKLLQATSECLDHDDRIKALEAERDAAREGLRLFEAAARELGATCIGCPGCSSFDCAAEAVLSAVVAQRDAARAEAAAAKGKLAGLLASSRDCRDWLAGINVYEGDDPDEANNHDNGIIDGLTQAIAAAEQGGE
jgi:hypothetical protein